MFVDDAGFVSPATLRWKDILFLVDLFVDMTFFADIVITFHTAIWEISRKV